MTENQPDGLVFLRIKSLEAELPNFLNKKNSAYLTSKERTLCQLQEPKF